MREDHEDLKSKSMTREPPKAPEFGELRESQRPRSVNDIQVGGLHYKSEYQHWDLVINHGLHYLIGCASKYVTRRKDPKKRGEDLNKAVHYIEKAEERNVLASNHHGTGLSTETVKDIELFSLHNRLSHREHQALLAMINGDYDLAKGHIRKLFFEQA